MSGSTWRAMDSPSTGAPRSRGAIAGGTPRAFTSCSDGGHRSRHDHPRRGIVTSHRLSRRGDAAPRGYGRGLWFGILAALMTAVMNILVNRATLRLPMG